MNYFRSALWRKGWIVLPPFVLLIIALIAIGLTPVTLSVDGGVAKQSVANGSWEEVAIPTPSKLVVTTRGEGFAELERPELQWPEVFSEELVSANRNFRPDPETGAYRSQGRGEIVFRGVFGFFSLVLSPSSTVKSITVERRSRGFTRSWTLYPGERLTTESPARRYQRTTSFMWRPIATRLDSSEGSTLTASIGNYTISAQGADRIPFLSLAPKAILVFAEGLLIFLASIVLVVFGWGVARSVDSTRTRSSTWIYMQAVAGVSGLALVTNSLAYVLPTRWSAWIVVLGGLAVIAWRLFRERGRLALSFPFVALSKGLALALLPAFFLFFPVLHWAGWYAGKYGTDLFEYLHLASLLRDESLIGLRGSANALDSGLLTSGAGFEWRSIDSVLASATGIISFSSSLTGLVIVSIAVFLLFALSLFGLLKQGSTSSRLLIVLLLLSPPFVALFIENYQSHYFFVALVPGLVLAFAEVLRSRPPSNRAARAYCYLLIGAITAAAIAAYPYFAIIVLTSLTAAVIVVRRNLRVVIATMSKVLLATGALLNVGLVSLLYLGDSASRYRAGLDEIAREVLLDPYSLGQLGFAGLGIVPYIWRPVADGQPYMGWLGSNLWSLGDGAWSPGLVEIGALLLFLGALVWAIAWRRSVTDFSFIGSCAVVLSLGGFLGLFAVSDSPYSALKVGWTAAALFPLIAVAPYLHPGRSRILVIALIPLALLWIRTDLLDRADWLISREGREASLSHSSVQPSLTSLRHTLEEGPDAVELIRGEQPIFGSDRERVLFSHIRVMIRDLDLRCQDCDGYQLDPSGLPYRPKCAKDLMIIRIGVSDEASECGKPLIDSGPTFEVYGSPASRNSAQVPTD